MNIPDSKFSATYNWNPAVHEVHFNETLWFLIIRLHEPLHRPVAEQVADLLSAAGIQHACAYPLFGSWDALVRVWLTPVAYRRFIDVLQMSVDHQTSHNVETFRGFRTNEIRYLWRDEDSTPMSKRDVKATIASHVSEIERVAGMPEMVNDPAWARLKEVGLLFERPSMPPGSVKFYTCLERTADSMVSGREEETIVDAMKAASVGGAGISMVTRSTLYCGEGTLAAYLIRSVADGYDDVLALAESFDVHLRDTRLRPMTLLIANPTGGHESDCVNDTRHLSPSDDSTLDLLDLEASVFSEIPSRHRSELNSLVVSACELTRDDDASRDILLKILRASALDDREEFRASLSFLLNFEPEFKQRLIGEFADVFGSSWLKSIRQLCASSGEWERHAEHDMAQNLKAWTLGTYVTTARAVSSLHPQFKGWLVSELGEEWDAAAADLLALRNDLSHGRVYEFPRLNFYDDFLSDYLKRVMSAAVFWWRSRASGLAAVGP